MDASAASRRPGVPALRGGPRRRRSQGHDEDLGPPRQQPAREHQTGEGAGPQLLDHEARAAEGVAHAEDGAPDPRSSTTSKSADGISAAQSPPVGRSHVFPRSRCGDGQPARDSPCQGRSHATTRRPGRSSPSSSRWRSKGRQISLASPVPWARTTVCAGAASPSRSHRVGDAGGRELVAMTTTVRRPRGAYGRPIIRIWWMMICGKTRVETFKDTGNSPGCRRGRRERAPFVSARGATAPAASAGGSAPSAPEGPAPVPRPR